MNQNMSNEDIEKLLQERDRYKQEVIDLKARNEELSEELKKYMTDMASYIDMTDSTISVLREEIAELKVERDGYKEMYEILILALFNPNTDTQSCQEKNMEE